MENDRHAYMIMCHDNFEQLSRMLALLESEYNDIYIHVDKKVSSPPYELIKKYVKKSTITFVKRVDVKWGGYSQIKAEFTLLSAAVKKRHAYYHLLSGMDIPLKSQSEIRAFFDGCNKSEYIGFDNKVENDSPLYDRVRLFYVFQDFLGKNDFPKIVVRIENWLLRLQKRYRVDRSQRRSITYYKGPQWFSITHEMACHVLDRKNEVHRLFVWTLGPDEFFLQTIAASSPYRERIINNSLRYIDWKRGSPYTFTFQDKEMLINRPELFARKFDQKKDMDIVNSIISFVLNKENGRVPGDS